MGPERISTWIEFIQDEGYVQFGENMYHMSSGTFMGTSPAPDLANIFALVQEYEVVERNVLALYLQAQAQQTTTLYPLLFIEQYAIARKGIICI